MENLTILLLLPLLGAVLNRLLGARWGKQGTAILACSTVGVSFLVAVAAFIHLASLGESHRASGLIVQVFHWDSVGSVHFNFSLLLDPLSAIMICVVTGVGFLIHIFSMGYMGEESDSEYARYFAYLNFFIFSMLTLILAANFFVMFVGWELVGVCSYLLIGFFRGKKSANNAAKKAFIVNRIGDFGFLIAIFIMIIHFGSLEFSTILPSYVGKIPAGSHLAVLTAFLLFMGAMGKSAQLPLHVWLPDAMEGPTPVSALIHAATMVTAGVYMVFRCHVIFEAAPSVMQMIAWIGGLTALFAATIALVQNDIKRVMAYSTLSQLGYMVMGVGVGAYAAGFFHLFTHAFFKALLFLGCGSIMHSLHGELDMAKMGGLRKKMPITFWTFSIGAACLIGLPFTSGFFSKDEILLMTLTGRHHSFSLWAIGAATAGLTALYVGRLYFKTFFGTPRDQQLYDHAHESGTSMTIPLVVLAAGSLLAGYAWLPHSWGNFAPFEHWLEPLLADISGEAHGVGGNEVVALMLLYTGMAAAALWFCYKKFGSETGYGESLKRRIEPVYQLLWNKYYVDEIYEYIFVKGFLDISKSAWRSIDIGLIDATVNGVGELAQGLGQVVRRWVQTGYVRFYAGATLLGVVLILTIALSYF